MPLDVDREIHQTGSEFDVAVVAEIGLVPAELVRLVPAELVGPVPAELVGPVPAELIGPVPAELIGPVPAELIGPVPAELIGPVLVELVGPSRAGIGPDGWRCGCGPRHGHDPAGRPAAAASGRPGTDREWSNRRSEGSHIRESLSCFTEIYPSLET
ncbi:hypothetical protein AAH979_22135 [Plantactinospora sp. ZYX-F-223]|uniref:hypothetical protein n=1 Tax=Plantactinospora sp. ZYX-F-223 TaxID=3144103 RepID=UPI0031FDC8AA